MENNILAVLLPVYYKDHPTFFSLSVKSILKQTYSSFTLYIGVDGPVNDDLTELLKEFERDPRVKIIWFDKNRGLAYVLNDLIDIASINGAEFFARMDADDISMPNRFEKQMNFLEENEEIDVVGGAISEIDEDGQSRRKIIIYPKTHEDCRLFFSKRNPHAHPAVIFRKRFFEKIGHYYRTEYRQNQDTMLWLDGFFHGTSNANITDVILKFRMTEALFKKRRNGWNFAKKQFKDRLKINRILGYGLGADLFGLCMFILLISPSWIRKFAYKFFR